MNCKRIRKLILADYSDGETSPELTKKINDHLKVCERCRRFKEAVEKTAIGPFKNAREFVPPDTLWVKIREALLYEQRRNADSVFFRLSGLLRTIFIVKKPVLALAFAAAVIIMGVAFMNVRRSNEEIASYLDTQADFIAHLDSDTVPDNKSYMNMDVNMENILSRRNFCECLYV